MKKYIIPKTEITYLEKEDVIRTSAGIDDVVLDENELPIVPYVGDPV